MSEQASILHRLAEAFTSGTRPFQLENLRLAGLGQTVTPVDSPEPRYEIADGCWIDFEADKKLEVSAGPAADGKGLHLLLRNRGDSRWFSFSYAISLETLASARYLGLLVAA